MYTCDICNYSTDDRSNLQHHNKSKKHILIKERENKLLKIKDDENEILKQKLLVSETENKSLKIKDNENEILKQNLVDSKNENEILKQNLVDSKNENEILKQNLVDSKNENCGLLKYIELILQNKNNSKIRKYKKKCTIPATIRNSLWQKYFNKSTKGKCCCCKLETISRGNFDCGHIISEHNGGLVTINNLKPICRLCNSSMSTMNMDEFIKNYELDRIPVNK
jgi:hypothetical protein